MTKDRSTRPADRAAQAVGRLRLGRWSEARTRVLPRLVPAERAGPLRRRTRCLPDGARSPVLVEVGLDVEGGIVRVDEALLEAWAVDEDHIWRTALANAARRPRPLAAVLTRRAIRFLLLVGDAWTTGLITQPALLATLGLGGATPGRATAPAASSVLMAAPRPETLIVADPVGSPGGHLTSDEVAAPLLALAGDIAALDGEPALPLVALLGTESHSFPAGRILE